MYIYIYVLLTYLQDYLQKLGGGTSPHLCRPLPRVILYMDEISGFNRHRGHDCGVTAEVKKKPQNPTNESHPFSKHKPPTKLQTSWQFCDCDLFGMLICDPNWKVVGDLQLRDKEVTAWITWLFFVHLNLYNFRCWNHHLPSAPLFPQIFPDRTSGYKDFLASKSAQGAKRSR